MESTMIDWMMLLMMLVSGGKNELLDYVPTDAYWQNRGIEKKAENMLGILKTTAKPADDATARIKDLGSNNAKIRDEAQKKLIAIGPAILGDIKPLLKSDDAEVVARAEAIIKEISASSRVLLTNRLMAIRTLGELKAKDALPALEKLQDSKDLFVADYARAAIARINDKPVVPAKPDPKALAGDVMLLPKDCGVVGQLSGVASKGMPMDKIIESFVPQNEDKGPIIEKVTKSLLKLVDKTGNVRLDAITVGVAEDLSKNSGFAIVIARGLYDAQTIKDVIKEGIPEAKAEKVDGVDVIKEGRELTFLLPSNELLIIPIIGPRSQREQLGERLVNDLVAAVKAGKGTLADNADMVKLIKSIEGSPAAWAVMKVSDAYHESQLFAPFDTITMTGQQKDDVLKLALVAQGKKADEVKAAVDYFNENLGKAQQELAQMAEQMPIFKPIAEFFAGIKAESSDSGMKVTVTGQLKDCSPLSILGTIFTGRMR
ncbi:MAG: hypothetical protein HZA50_03200 [Planctomycetes bacterium]|nr:hypothetical protein [Planctomycetota bacterium]